MPATPPAGLSQSLPLSIASSSPSPTTSISTSSAVRTVWPDMSLALSLPPERVISQLTLSPEPLTTNQPTRRSDRSEKRPVTQPAKVEPASQPVSQEETQTSENISPARQSSCLRT